MALRLDGAKGEGRCIAPYLSSFKAGAILMLCTRMCSAQRFDYLRISLRAWCNQGLLFLSICSSFWCGEWCPRVFFNAPVIGVFTSHASYARDPESKFTAVIVSNETHSWSVAGTNRYRHQQAGSIAAGRGGQGDGFSFVPS